jgi:hypothetical protein
LKVKPYSSAISDEQQLQSIIESFAVSLRYQSSEEVCIQRHCAHFRHSYRLVLISLLVLVSLLVLISLLVLVSLLVLIRIGHTSTPESHKSAQLLRSLFTVIS